MLNTNFLIRMLEANCTADLEMKKYQHKECTESAIKHHN